VLGSYADGPGRFPVLTEVTSKRKEAQCTSPNHVMLAQFLMVAKSNVIIKLTLEKCNLHGCQNTVMGYAFPPCIMTTTGQVDAHCASSFRLLYILATGRAEMVHIVYSSTVSCFCPSSHIAKCKIWGGSAYGRYTRLAAPNCYCDTWH